MGQPALVVVGFLGLVSGIFILVALVAVFVRLRQCWPASPSA
jgi:hypothetical protein